MHPPVLIKEELPPDSQQMWKPKSRCLVTGERDCERPRFAILWIQLFRFTGSPYEESHWSFHDQDHRSSQETWLSQASKEEKGSWSRSAHGFFWCLGTTRFIPSLISGIPDTSRYKYTCWQPQLLEPSRVNAKNKCPALWDHYSLKSGWRLVCHPDFNYWGTLPF